MGSTPAPGLGRQTSFADKTNRTPAQKNRSVQFKFEDQKYKSDYTDVAEVDSYEKFIQASPMPPFSYTDTFQKNTLSSTAHSTRR
ncbi:hypothetical protein SARC_16752 [Sphaeroforma arctica JP610]|uniref:Uncharacterized protein n=1 Tax=Sphaeroforma arctica JP610 TaxID=667725 RepID=A0A0L0F283_9EUKA|nr:hypothetical protein SARC_16752 [Sphaeroforma arctica JP610]KNC70719.1 hypothetical protein SARC_16752 [Sphaeroforma arctica JP610]|eukprot:XP_014144621.1 hypothetical protein SARC_16752 [Sphaeroforma arctica JP610]